jgi:hypothetical protein
MAEFVLDGIEPLGRVAQRRVGAEEPQRDRCNDAGQTE